MVSQSSDTKRTLQESRYYTRLKYTIFPIDLRDFREILAKNGYELTAMRGFIPTRPLRVSFDGDVARKGEITVYMDTPEGLVGIYGKSNREVIESFDELSRIFKDEMGFDLDSSIWYREIDVHYLVRTGSSPITNISRVAEDNPHFSKFTEIIGEETSSFSLRLSPKNVIPNSENWFDITIEQDILLAEAYHIGIVYRNVDPQKVRNFALSIDDKITSLVDLVEGKT